MTCPDCHEPMKPAMRRCPACGYRVDRSVIAVPGAVSDPCEGRYRFTRNAPRMNGWIRQK